MDGWALVAEGRQAEVYLRSDGSVVKLMREVDDGPWVEREEAAMRAMAAAGVRVPAVLGPVEVDGRPGLAMERLDGSDLMTVMGSKPWLIPSLSDTMGRLHAALHGSTAPDVLPDVHDVLVGHLADCTELSTRQRAEARSELDRLPAGDRLLHGDLHLGNLLGDPADPFTIDWGGATRGDPTADVALTVLMHRMAKPGPGASRFVRTMAPLGARYIARRYLAAYRTARPVDADLLERWVAVHAAARLVHGIDDERAGLRRVVADAFGA